MGEFADHMSLKEAADELGLSKSRVEQFVRDGRLVVVWFAERRYVARAAVKALKKLPRDPGRPKKPPKGHA